MQVGSQGNLAKFYAMQSRNTDIKADIQRLTIEISSGQVADIRKAVSGNTTYITDIERSLTKLGGYDLAAREAGQFASGAQIALERVDDLNVSFRNILLAGGQSGVGEVSNNTSAEARHTLSSVIGALNTSVGGRSLFGGVATTTVPLANADTIMSALGTAVAGAGSVDDIITAVDAWFNDPAGFGTVGYLGSDTSLAPFTLSDTDKAQFDLRADDPVFRDTLRNLALIGLADDPSLGLTHSQQVDLLGKTSAALLSAKDGVTTLQAKIGFSENKIETAVVRQGAERSSLEMARNELLAIDPFQAATELEQVQFQLQSLYAITSRMSQLSLVNFL